MLLFLDLVRKSSASGRVSSYKTIWWLKPFDFLRTNQPRRSLFNSSQQFFSPESYNDVMNTFLLAKRELGEILSSVEMIDEVSLNCSTKVFNLQWVLGFIVEHECVWCDSIPTQIAFGKISFLHANRDFRQQSRPRWGKAQQFPSKSHGNESDRWRRVNQRAEQNEKHLVDPRTNC